MAHLTGFGLENFRVFKKNTWFDFAPITILTGTNSSGKSSINKALLLITENLNNTTNVEFKVNENSYTQLGSLKNVKSQKTKPIKFKQKIWTNNFNFSDQTKGKEFYVEYILDEESIPVQNERNLFMKELNIWDENDWVLKLKISYSSERDADEIENITFFLDIDVDVAYEFNYNYLWKLFIKDNNDKLFFNKEFYVSNIKEDFTTAQIQKFENKFFKSNFLFSNTLPFSNNYNFINDLIGSLFGNEDWDSPILKNYNFEKYFLNILNDEFQVINQIIEYDYLNDLISVSGNKFIKNLNSFLNDFVNTIKEISNNTFYIKLSNVNINRLHTINNQESNFYNVISRFNTDLLNINEEKSKFYNKWSKELNIQIEIKDIEGAAYNVFVNKSNIADLGSGVTKLVNILLNIFLNDNCLIIIEEPETNLHPALQSKLADMFVEASKVFKIQFIIETHSEYIIRRLQYLTAKKEIKPEDSIIHYLFNPSASHILKTKEQLRTIRIMEDGRLNKEFGSGFFDESSKLIESIWEARSLN